MRVTRVDGPDAHAYFSVIVEDGARRHSFYVQGMDELRRAVRIALDVKELLESVGKEI